ncbi:hypothetical protein [Actinocorallia sp. A-T 12471]|uniref:hypothetical protein n=1 Tax=Actinocorallia sp. A-T 12471 TaxID=3089813 RepID=UPI0029CD055C|nr:hypothetical protein [Actinocorallia sp. A-T 12471]MDX6740495.1 hypothetical protein [Actinocorallia sp. A-T 12471]
MLALISPDRYYRNSFEEAIAEFEALNGEGDGGLTPDKLVDSADFIQFLKNLNNDAVLNARHQYWWCDTSEQVYIARVTLTLRDEWDQLEIFIRPGRRGQGHFTRIMAATLPVVEGLGADVSRLDILVPDDDRASQEELARWSR